MNVKSWPIFAGMESAQTLRRAISVRVATALKKWEAYVLVRFILSFNLIIASCVTN